MASEVVCAVCQEHIPRREAIEVASRVYCCIDHVKEWKERQSSADQWQDKEAEAKKQLEDYICECYGIKQPTALMRRQINKFKTDNGLSYRGMFLTLYYCFALSNPPAVPMLDAGVAIIPYFYDAAKAYYKKKREIQQQAETLDLATMARGRVINVRGTGPASHVKGGLIDIGAIGGSDDEQGSDEILQ